MVHGYKPLPTYGKSRVAELKARQPIPPDVWGPDPARRKLAFAIGEIAKLENEWPNARFVPEDPFKLLILPSYGQIDVEFTCIVTGIEELLGWDESDEFWCELYEMTFGQVVDVLLEKSPGYIERVRLATPAPLSGPEALEARPCPSLASFLNLRAFVATWELGSSGRAIQPATPIGRTLSGPRLKQLDDFVRERFGVDSHLFDTADADASCASCLGVVATLGACCCWPFWRNTMSEGWEWRLVFHHPIALLVGVMLSLVLCASLSKAWSAARQLRLRGKRPLIVTFADLVRWIQSERAKLVPKAG